MINFVSNQSNLLVLILTLVRIRSNPRRSSQYNTEARTWLSSNTTRRATITNSNWSSSVIMLSHYVLDLLFQRREAKKVSNEGRDRILIYLSGAKASASKCGMSDRYRMMMAECHWSQDW